MKKSYIAPAMEILDSELEGFLAASTNPNKFYEPGKSGQFNARQGGFDDFDGFDDFEDDEY